MRMWYHLPGRLVCEYSYIDKLTCSSLDRNRSSGAHICGGGGARARECSSCGAQEFGRPFELELYICTVVVVVVVVVEVPKATIIEFDKHSQ